MTTKLVQNGATIKRTLAGNVTVNRLYTLEGGAETANNGMPVVAAVSGVTGGSVDFLVEGVFTLTKLVEAGSGLNQGDIVYWRATGGVNQVTGLATAADGVAGTAWAAAATGAATAVVKLLGHGGKAATP